MIMIIPNEVIPLDTLEFCRLLKIDKEDFKKRFQRAEHYAPYLPYPFLKQLSKEDYAYLQENAQVSRVLHPKELFGIIPLNQQQMF